MANSRRGGRAHAFPVTSEKFGVMRLRSVRRAPDVSLKMRRNTAL